MNILSLCKNSGYAWFSVERALQRILPNSSIKASFHPKIPKSAPEKWSRTPFVVPVLDIKTLRVIIPPLCRNDLRAIRIRMKLRSQIPSLSFQANPNYFSHYKIISCRHFFPLQHDFLISHILLEGALIVQI